MSIPRMLRHTSEAAMPTPRMLGVDEFALRRGKKYGTILVNLETGLPVDLLPDRQAATLETWLKQHPGVLLSSRDRAGEFARGAKAGAPEARHPADRFHVLRNLAEVVEKVRGLASPGAENDSPGDHADKLALSFTPALAASS